MFLTKDHSASVRAPTSSGDFRSDQWLKHHPCILSVPHYRRKRSDYCCPCLSKRVRRYMLECPLPCCHLMALLYLQNTAAVLMLILWESPPQPSEDTIEILHTLYDVLDCSPTRRCLSPCHLIPGLYLSSMNKQTSSHHGSTFFSSGLPMPNPPTSSTSPT